MQPDLVIVDMALRSSHGMQLLSQIKGLGNGAKTLVWSTFDERMFAERAIRTGAMGYVNKREPLEIILRAIRQVLRGEVYLSLKMTKIMLQRLGSGKLADEDPLASLSNREIEVFRMVGQGITTRQIARQLGVKPKTVEANREKIKTKLNLEKRCRANPFRRPVGAGKRIAGPLATQWVPCPRSSWAVLRRRPCWLSSWARPLSF